MSTQTFFKGVGTTSQSIPLSLIQNAGATSPGDPITGLAYNTSSLTAYYKINGTGALTAITLATQTSTGAYSSGGFVEISSTNAPGLYRFDLPNAVIATAGIVTITFTGAASLATHTVVINVGMDISDTVRAGLTALPNVASGSAGAVLTSGTGTSQLSVASGGIALLNANVVNASALATDAVTEIVTALLTTQMTESYAADGTAPTVAQALHMLISSIFEVAVTSTTMTTKKLDGSTSAMTFTLNDATNPTSRTRAT